MSRSISLERRLAYSPAEVSRLLGLSRGTTYRLARTLGVRHGRRLLIPAAALRRWLENPKITAAR